MDINISFVDIDMNANMPIEAPEAWTMTMFVCLFVGGYWCGAMTFTMLLIVKMYCE